MLDYKNHISFIDFQAVVVFLYLQPFLLFGRWVSGDHESRKTLLQWCRGVSLLATMGKEAWYCRKPRLSSLLFQRTGIRPPAK